MAEGVERGPASPDATEQAPSSVSGVDFGERYRVLGRLGRGAMGDVYRAHDDELSRVVALKVIRSDAFDRDLALERFRREIALASRVTHPNVLRVYDLSEKNGHRFLSMQYVEGRDLAELLRLEGVLPIWRAVAIARQLAEGLAAAHAQGVIHRDLKPRNVLLDTNDHVFVADFGVARSLEDATMTATGALLGSPAYMSPEQVKSERVDERSDIYSFGVILYELLTGERPFVGDSVFTIMEKRLHGAPPRVRDTNPAVPAYLEPIVARCLATDPAARYRSVLEIIADLDAQRPPELAAPRPRRRWLYAAAGGLVLGAVLAVGWVTARRTPPISASASPSGSAPPGASVTNAAGARPARVLIVRFQNNASDPMFDDTLELVLERSLYDSHALVPLGGGGLRSIALDLKVDLLDNQLGRLIAERDAARVLTVRGAVARNAGAFTVSMTMIDAATDAVVLTRTEDARDANGIVPILGRFGWAIRAYLGETQPSDPSRLEQTGMSASLDADHELTQGIQLTDAGRNLDALPHLERTVVLDPEFARGHWVLALGYMNLGRASDGEREFKIALKGLDRMTEHERLRFLGDYHGLLGQYDKGIAAFEALARGWPEDWYSRVNLTVAYFNHREAARAVDIALQIAAQRPKWMVNRSNLVSYYVNENRFDDAIREGAAIVAEFGRRTASVDVNVAVAEIALGHEERGLEAYSALAKDDPSVRALALADLAMYKGRLSEAASVLAKGIEADLAEKNEDGAALKQALLSEVRLRRGDKRGAIAAADKAASASAPPTAFIAARTYIEAGNSAKALAVADRMEQSLGPDPRMYSKMLRGEALLAGRKARAAIDAFEEARHVADGWLIHLALARAYLDLGAFAEAHTELKTCLDRPGEGSVAFLDDFPTLRYVAVLPYYVARVQAGLGSPDAAASYQQFLRREESERDVLVDDARRRLAALR